MSYIFDRSRAKPKGIRGENYIRQLISEVENDPDNRDDAKELKSLADIVEDARDTLRQGDVRQALALLDTALNPPDPEQWKKYNEWLNARDLARRSIVQPEVQAPFWMTAPWLQKRGAQRIQERAA
jgi:hypothetical protein